MWNPWKHFRLGGSVLVIAAALMGGNLPLTLIGLLVQYIGVVGAVDRLERLMDIITKENEEK